jgi:four helix bundle protein
MLRVYEVAIDVLRGLRGPIETIQRFDPDLARQLRRASSSAALNIAEGSAGRGGTRTARYADALDSMRETLACLEVAEALGYMPAIDDALENRMRCVIGTLVKLVAPKAA